ncbi:MAG: hypothetical protein U0T62_00400 [Buchnera aphidicola (Nurudea ibofushi)]
MVFLKKFLISIILLCLFFLFSLIFLIYSHVGLNIACYLVNHYIPELKIKKSIGRLNNFVLKDVSYYSNDKCILIKELYIEMSFNFLKNFYVNVNNLLLKKCSIKIFCNSFKKISKKESLFNLKIFSFLNFPIKFKNTKFSDISFSINSLLLTLDYGIGEYYWNGKKLECLHSKVDNIYVKECTIKNVKEKLHNKIIVNKNFNFKKEINYYLNYLRKSNFRIPIFFDIKNFYSDNIYFFNKCKTRFSQCFLNFTLDNDKIDIKKLHILSRYFKIDIFGVYNFCKDFYFNFFLNCVYFKHDRSKEHIHANIHGFLLKNLSIDLNFHGFIKSRIYIKFFFKNKSSNLCSKLLIPFFIIKNDHKIIFSLKSTIIQVLGNLENYHYSLNTIIDIKSLIPVHLYILGRGNHSCIFFEKIKYVFMKNAITSKNLLNFFNKKRLNYSTLVDGRNNDFDIKFLLENVIHVFSNFKERYDVFFDIKFLYKYGVFKNLNIRSKSHFFEICNRWIISTINKVLKKKNFSSINRFQRESNIDVFFKLKSVNNVYSNFLVNINGNVSIENKNDDYKITIKILGNHLISKFFNISNFSIMFKKNNSHMVTVNLSVKDFTILNFYISSFCLKFNNYKIRHNFYLNVLRNSHIFTLCLNGKYNTLSRLWIEEINSVYFSVPLFNISLKKIFLIFYKNDITSNFYIFSFLNDFLFTKTLTYLTKNTINIINTNVVEKAIFFLNNLQSFYRFKKPFTCEVKCILYNFGDFKKWTLKWNFEIKNENEKSEFFFGLLKFYRVDETIFFLGSFEFKNVTISLLKFLSANFRILSGKFYGTLEMNDICSFKFFCDLLIKNLLINGLFNINNLHISNIVFLTNFDDTFFKSFTITQNWYNFIFNFKFLQFCSLKNKLGQFFIIKVFRMPLYRINF